MCVQYTERRLQRKEQQNSCVRTLLDKFLNSSVFVGIYADGMMDWVEAPFFPPSYEIKKMFLPLCVGSFCSLPPAGVAQATSEFGFQACLGNALTAYGSRS